MLNIGICLIANTTLLDFLSNISLHKRNNNPWSIQAERYFSSTMDGFRWSGGDRGSGPPAKHNLLCFLRNTGTDLPSRSNWTHRIQLLLDGGQYGPSVKYVYE